jgi:hypothetical protein
VRRAARILSRAHGYRYYDWTYTDGRFRFFEHPVNLKREDAAEGKYLIQTEEPQLTAVEAVTIYKELRGYPGGRAPPSHCRSTGFPTSRAASLCN